MYSWVSRLGLRLGLKEGKVVHLVDDVGQHSEMISTMLQPSVSGKLKYNIVIITNLPS